MNNEIPEDRQRAAREVLSDLTYNYGPNLVDMADTVLIGIDEAWDQLAAIHDTPNAIAEAVRDRASEVAGSAVPIYNYGIIETAVEDWVNLFLDDPESGPAFGGEPTPINILAGNLYDLCSSIAWARIEKLEDEANHATAS